MNDQARVARVYLAGALPHLDGLFDYLIPDSLEEKVTVGSRVRVPFAGRLISAVVAECADESSFAGKLRHLSHTSVVPSYSSKSIELARVLAKRYGGSVSDVLRLAAPPRVAAVERRDWTTPPPQWDLTHAREALNEGSASPHGLPAGARMVWQAWPENGQVVAARALLSQAVNSAGESGQSIVVVPDLRAVDIMMAQAHEVGLTQWSARTPGPVARIHANDGASARYGAHLAALHGHVRIIIGTRAATFTPVPHLAYIGVWDDGHSSMGDPHAPYPHARVVASIRAEEEAAALAIAGFAPSVAAQALVEHGWASLSRESRVPTSSYVPHILPLDDSQRVAEGGTGTHWLPSRALSRVREALNSGPVVVLVPRAGYVRAVACATCSTIASCSVCEGSLVRGTSATNLVCAHCATSSPDWHCPECRNSRVMDRRIGVEKIAEELTRMLPRTRVQTSSAGAGVLSDGDVSDGVVVATPGAVPAVAGGYRHCVCVDAPALVAPHAGGDEQALRMAFYIAAMVAPQDRGGAVTFVGSLPGMVLRALRQWDSGVATRQLYTERAELGFPPHRRTVVVEGDPEAVAIAEDIATREASGHVTVGPRTEAGATLVVSRGKAQAVVDAIRAHQRETSRAGGSLVKIRVDAPIDYLSGL